MNVKEKPKTNWKGIATFFRLAIPIVIGIGMVLSMSWLIKGIYNQIFVPQKELVTIKLTDADAIIAERENDCETENFRPLIYISRTSDNVKSNNYTIKSPDSIQFSISLPNVELEVVKYIGGKTTIDLIPASPQTLYKGRIKSITVQATNLQQLRLQEFYCAQSIKFLPIGGMVWSGQDDSSLQIQTVQGFSVGDTVKVTIEPLDILSDMGNEKFDKIELNFKIAKDTAMGINAISSSFGQSSLPDVGKDDVGISKNESVSFFASAESLQVISPIGTIQIGNNLPIEMYSLARLANETLELPRSSDNAEYEYKVASTVSNGEYEISGITASIAWKGQELNKSDWDKAPEYIKAGLFGLLLTVIGGLWTLRQPLWDWLSSTFSFLNPKINLPSGSCILIMKSGVVIGGELSSKPTRSHPYYLIKNARRKSSLSGKWDKEIISEIQVREDAVEQSYAA